LRNLLAVNANHGFSRGVVNLLFELGQLGGLLVPIPEPASEGKNGKHDYRDGALPMQNEDLVPLRGLVVEGDRRLLSHRHDFNRYPVSVGTIPA
jgi:hypothetical protein